MDISWQQLIRYVDESLTINGSRDVRTFAYRSRHIVRLLGYVTPDKVGYDELQGYVVARINEGAKPKTINNELSWIRKCYREAQKRKLIMDPPRIENLRVGDNARRGFASPDEIARVIDNLREDVIRDVTRFAYFTGWRRGEILSLSWSDVDFEDRCIRLRGANEKTGRGRVLPFSDVVSEIIDRRWADRFDSATGATSDLVFHRGGAAIGSFLYQWRTACALAGLPSLLFHDLRRSFSRNARNAGVPERVIMALMGHTTNSMFIRYNIVDEADLRSQVEIVEAFIRHLGDLHQPDPTVRRLPPPSSGAG